jgi:uncharacterized protein YajQ (UPF0234 family)
MDKGFILSLTAKENVANPFNAAYQVLSQQELFSEQETFWFAWREEEIKLPSILQDLSLATDTRWDVIRIFSPKAELRFQKRGREQQILLLLEDETKVSQLENTLADFIVKRVRCFPQSEGGKRILAGEKMKLGVSNETGIEKRTTRGVVIFPRELEYKGITADIEEALVAEVREYFDHEKRLQCVRYCRICSHPGPTEVWRLLLQEEIGEMEVKPL